MKRAEFKTGDIVKSRYRNPWIGVIEGLAEWYEYKGKPYPIYNVKPILDKTGRTQPKHVKSRRLSESWLEKAK